MSRTDGTVKDERWSAELERRIRTVLNEIRYGTVTLVIQDGKVIQIDKNEKIRLV